VSAEPALELGRREATKQADGAAILAADRGGLKADGPAAEE
jgi:hypothetical protein